MNKKGFTLIELLAVIIILGILMIIAIPSVTSYINNSRKSAYVDTAKEVITGARNKVNDGKLGMFDTDATYYIPSSYIKTENASKSPYGEFTEAYVVITYNGKGYSYYWTSVDDVGEGIKDVVAYDKLETDNVESDLTNDMIDPNITKRGVGERSKILVLDPNTETWKEVVGGATTKVPEEGGNGGSTTPTNTAATTILATAQAAGQLNQIPGTDIYIFKGGNPANYVKFNNEDWRIIGIYGNQLKIQRVGVPTGLTSIAYNTTTPNPGWANSSLKTYLNETYYGTLSSDAKEMIDNGSWNVGAVACFAIASQAYTSATTTSTVGSTTHTTPWTGKVGLMATYEFLYASSGENCLTTDGYYYYLSCGTATYDWMKPGYSSWSLSSSDRASSALSVDSSGYVYNGSVLGGDGQALPAVFLKSSVTIASGDGTSGNPYILNLE